ncbi:MAG: hypothetical protein Q8R24_09045 [Legionellaceae bacterium]|nr:hypothetical protein [Legionellaceae bacterium]
MKIKTIVLASVLGFSYLASGVSFAMPDAHNDQGAEPAHCKQVHHVRKALFLTEQQHVELKQIRHHHDEQISPLLHEKHALIVRLDGQIVTPGTKLNDLETLVQQINQQNEKILKLDTATKFEVYQKTGALLPPPPPHHGVL